ncbi:hypothetical protein M011DRAFT_465428 [Sporormia fimetaria CBS 119925]|uniref:Uncharacterized protein n=1 Tax=Sporormia fimetaria CBS 119925 TaxID=1340428 RepID=A0A6A6VGN9_9PLEO|nr:hypothetical protein M011DRAFT_465428 [Sporormia fimetaria CBS 119925]
MIQVVVKYLDMEGRFQHALVITHVPIVQYLNADFGSQVQAPSGHHPRAHRLDHGESPRRSDSAGLKRLPTLGQLRRADPGSPCCRRRET